MGVAEQIPCLSVSEYLAGEQDSPVRHEYIDGQVYAMAGASDRHIRLAGNLYRKISDHLDEDEQCESFISDMKVRVSETVFYYPDVVVACDGPNADLYYRKAPRLIVEVLSPSTASIDTDEKLLADRQIRTLKEYVIVAQDHMRVHVYRRRRGDIWQSEILTEPAQELRLASNGLTLTLAQVYHRVRLPKTPVPRDATPS
ncbi:MAG: Uma2 family endonuclease [Blastocatellia bacterium]